jgi:hypothetical protein
MRKINYCKFCIWFGGCQAGKVAACEYYDPADEEEADDIASREYKECLGERARAYNEIVDEMNK